MFSLIGLRADGATGAVDIIGVRTAEAAVTQARRFLSDHSICALVEVWRHGALIASVDAAEMPS